MMTDTQKADIVRLQKQGLGYRKIAGELMLSVNAVKSFCTRNPITHEENLCPVCGAPLTQTPHKRRKKFCSDPCRSAWWAKNPGKGTGRTHYDYVCPRCGRQFTSDKKDRVYCSRLCYADARRKAVSV